jgi:peptidoglycan/xylan/chitin deacetylase (PgdA/CDA1 family)
VTDLLILCHHGVSESWPSDFAIYPQRLNRQLRFLLRRGYRPMTLATAIERRPAGKALVVTFDDAYRSVLREAHPVLAALGVPATIFVPTGFATSQERLAWSPMDKWVGTPFEAELDCLSWDELRWLQGEGWEIGSHSRSHPDLTQLDDEELEAELRGSREDCERELQRDCTTLAYPFSRYDRRVKGVARAVGYRGAVILDSDLAVPRRGVLPSPGGSVDPFELVRAGIYRHDGWPRFLAKTSRTARRMRASRLWHRVVGAAPEPGA